MNAEVSDKKSYALFALNIIKAKGRKIFSQNSSMNCLAKSDSFFKELLNVFNTFFYSDIQPEKFEKAVCSMETSKTDKTRLELVSSLYGSYVSTMDGQGFKLPLPVSKASTGVVCENFEVEKRLGLLKQLFASSGGVNFAREKSENISYLEFSDIQNEAVFVIDEIKKLVESGGFSYGDFAVYVDKTEARQKFSDMMKASGIPVISSIYNENYENLKHKIAVYQKIGEICVELGAEGFSSEDLKNVKLESKAQKEICFEALDEVVKDLLSEILADDYALDKIISKKENSPKTLLETLYGSFNLFGESDREALIQEFGSIKGFYEYYKQGDFAKAISGLIRKNMSLFENTEIKDVVAGKIKSLNDLQGLYSLLDEMPDFDSFKEIMEWLPQDSAKEETSGAVMLASIAAKPKPKKFKRVYVAGLTENNYPGKNNSYPFISLETNEKLLSALREINSNVEFFLKTDELHFQERFNSLCSVFSQTVEKITLTTHVYDAKKQSLPSVFFKALTDFDVENFKKIKDIEKNENSEKVTLADGEFSQAENETVISKQDVLKLNPSAIAAFLKCPRKYYFKNLLNLKETSNFSASYGSIVHAVFEVMNRKFLDRYNKETALALSDVLFESKTDEAKAESAIRAGFKQNDIDLVKASDDLSLAEMKDNFKEALEDYSMCGYFDEAPNEAVCEKSFRFSLEELPNVIFDGRIDALLKTSEGLKVVDYKTGKDKVKKLYDAVDPDCAGAKNFDYQIPLYYFACQTSEDLKEFKDKIDKLGFVYVRPKSKHNGCDEDFVSAQRIEENREKILQNIKEAVVEKIVGETEFKKASGWDCENCSYKFLCDKEYAEVGND